VTDLYVTRRLTSRAPELRDLGGTKHIVGYASVFGKASRNLGGFVEQIDRRAFDSSMLAGWPDVVCRYNHDDNYLLGTTAADTLRLLIDDTGLLYDCLPPSFRSDILELCQRGDVSKSSFAFRVPEEGDYWERSGPGGMPLRTVINTDLVDVAPVNTPAYTEATAFARGLDGDILSSLARYAHADVAEIRSYLAANDESVPKFFRRSDRPAIAKTEVPEVADDETRDKLTSKERDDLPDSAFAYIAPDGTKHFPIHDASHVRNALARIAQGAQFGEEALPKVKAAAKRLGVSVAEQNNIFDLAVEARGELPPWLQKGKDKDAKDDDSDDDKDDDSDKDDSKDKKSTKKPAKVEKKSDEDETDEERAAKATYADLETCDGCGATSQYGQYCSGCGEPMNGDAPTGKFCSSCGSKTTAKRDEHTCGEETRDETSETDETRAAEEAKQAIEAEQAERYAKLMARRLDPCAGEGE
jgi:uncharacterized protein